MERDAVIKITYQPNDEATRWVARLDSNGSSVAMGAGSLAQLQAELGEQAVDLSDVAVEVYLPPPINERIRFVAQLRWQVEAMRGMIEYEEREIWGGLRRNGMDEDEAQFTMTLTERTARVS